jgi:hypothetical protein
MDQDIKQRLMEQVFSVLPVLPDDQQAYAAHHKAESEKRLVAQNRAAATAKKEREDREQEVRAREKAKPPLRPRPPRSASAAAATDTTESNSAGNASEKAESDASAAATSPERLAQIKDALQRVYEEHCKEKVASIDFLLSKYAGREEEFLRFVLAKYEISNPEQFAPAQQPTEAAEAADSPTKGQGTPANETAADSANGEEASQASSPQEESLSPSKSAQLLGSSSAKERTSTHINRNQAREVCRFRASLAARRASNHHAYRCSLDCKAAVSFDVAGPLRQPAIQRQRH